MNIYRYSIIESRRLHDTSGKKQAELGNSLNRKRWESIRCISFKFKFEKIQNFIITHLDVRVRVLFFRSRGKLYVLFIFILTNYVPAGDESEQILCKKSALSTLNQFQQNLCLYYRVFPAQALDQLELPRTIRFTSCIFAKSPRQLDALGASSRVENRDKSSLIEFIRYSICCAGTFFRVAKESSWSSHDERQPHAAGISRRAESLRIWVSLFFSIFFYFFFFD